MPYCSSFVFLYLTIKLERFYKMAIPVVIDDKDINKLIDFYYQRMESNDLEIFALNLQIETLQQEKERMSETIKDLISTIGYNSEWTYEEKIKFALSKSSPLTTSEIILVLSKYEFGIESKLKNISSIISEKIKAGVFVRVDNQDGAFKVAVKKNLILLDDIDEHTSDSGLEVETKKSVEGTQDDGYIFKMSKPAKAKYALDKIRKPSYAKTILNFLLLRDVELLEKNKTTYDLYLTVLTDILLRKADAYDTFYYNRSEDGRVKFGLADWLGDPTSSYFDEGRYMLY